MPWLASKNAVLVRTFFFFLGVMHFRHSSKTTKGQYENCYAINTSPEHYKGEHLAQFQRIAFNSSLMLLCLLFDTGHYHRMLRDYFDEIFNENLLKIRPLNRFFNEAVRKMFENSMVEKLVENGRFPWKFHWKLLNLLEIPLDPSKIDETCWK